MNIKFLPAATVAALLASTVVGSADWRISIPNGPTPFLTGPSGEDRLTEYYEHYGYQGAHTLAPGYGLMPRYRHYQHWRR